MYKIALLEKSDTINPNDYCRPLYRSADYSQHDEWLETSTYSGGPYDHLKWCPVWLKLGDVWWGKTYGDFDDFVSEGFKNHYEFIRGVLPAIHLIDLEYSGWYKRHPTYYNRTKKLRKNVMSIVLDFGKRKGQTIEHVLKYEPEYLMWVMHNVDRPYWKDVKTQLDLEDYRVYASLKYRKFKKPTK